MGTQNVLLKYTEFTPNSNSQGNFYCKPSKDYPQILYISPEYYKNLIRIYGKFPQRLNPIYMRLESLNGELVSTDLLLDKFNTGVIADIIYKHQGKCHIQTEKIGSRQVEIPKLEKGIINLKQGHL